MDSTHFYFIPIAKLDSSLLLRYKKLLDTYKNVISINKNYIDFKTETNRYSLVHVTRFTFYNLENNLITTRLYSNIKDPFYEFYYLLVNMVENNTHRHMIESNLFSKNDLKKLKEIYEN